MSDLTNEKTYDVREPLVTVATFPDPSEANLAQTALESAGIESFLQGETANSMIPVAFTARLQVRKEDEAEALAVLEDAVDSPESEADVTEAEMAGEEKGI